MEFYRFYLKKGTTRGAHTAQALALRVRLRCASDFHKYSIVNSCLSGLGNKLENLKSRYWENL
jgi:hypothetical protein